MTPSNISVFDLPAHLGAKTDPQLIAADERHFAAIERSLERSLAELSERLDSTRRAAGGSGQEAMDRDLEIHRLSARRRTLRRFGLDLCLGHFVPAGADEALYVGRLGLTDADGRRLLLDWRSPAAEPFFAATHAHPMGLQSRRRYRWNRGRITDYWDEAFTGRARMAHAAALDDQSAFVASLGASRSARMRDVLGTIQADQDAVIRAGSRGALVVDGGPGTGKTVVALHRAAYLLYADPRLREHRGGVLIVGPHQPYLDYVADVLPGLGEEGVRTCTLRDLLVEGTDAAPDEDPEVARLKSSVELVDAIEAAVGFYEEPPSAGLVVETPWADVRVGADEWAEAIEAVEPGTPHNESREAIWTELLRVLSDPYGEDAERIQSSLARSSELRTALERAWPLLAATDLVGDLWSVPAYLRRCAPGLESEQVRRLQRADPRAWTVSDLPLLDAARYRLGDPDSARRHAQQRATIAAERERRQSVIDDLISADDSELLVMSMLRGPDLQYVLVDETVAPVTEPGGLHGPFAHVIVDEAQELTDAEWQMLLRRCPSRSFTVVGDRAQARHGFAESWERRLTRVGFDRIEQAKLDVNYRTPQEVMDVAAPQIRSVRPDANVPTSIRRGGYPVVYGRRSELDAVVAAWLAAHAEGLGCVIGDPSFAARDRVRSLTPELAKGLEFDLVVLVDPDRFGPGTEGAVDRYVAMTRATRQLVVLSG